MARPFRKALANHEQRVKRYDETIGRQNRQNFKPNATGPVHRQHRPGSMQKGRCR